MNKIPVVFLVVVMAIFITITAACSGSSTSAKTAMSAPDFTLPGIDGRSVTLSSLRGKTVFLNFWATTCPPCVAEMPHFQDLYLDWADRDDMAMLTINMAENAATVKNFLSSNRYTFPVLLDSRAAVAQKYQVLYMPTSLVVDRAGLVQYRVVGPFKDKAAIVKVVEGIMQ